jgi:hypothetical protein
VLNGAFTLGNVDFSSDYTYVSAITAETQYTVGNDPGVAGSIYGDWESFGPPSDAGADLDVGSGLMVIANGATVSGYAIWRQTLQVQPNTAYTLSFWAADVDNDTPSSLAQFQAYAGTTAIGAPVTVTSTAGQWVPYTATWASGTASSVTLSIVDLNIQAGDNDFALDDISFTSCE